MKKLSLILIIGLLLCTNQAQASSFTLLPTDDVTLQGGKLWNNWDLWTYNYQGTISYPLLKFTASSDLRNALVSEQITSVSLELYAFSFYNTPDVKMYYYNNDNWNETQGSMSIPVYDTTNPIGEISSLLTPYYDFFSTSLDITPFLADDNDIYSLVLNNLDPNSLSNATFTSKEYSYGSEPAPYYAPKLHIETSAAVPEPATMLLFGSGLLGAFIKKRRKT